MTNLPSLRSALGTLVRLSLLLGLLVAGRTPAAAESRTALRDSVRLSFLSEAAGADTPQFRRRLTTGESAAQLEFEVSFRMRNLAELQARIAAGQIVPAAEMEDRYYPAAAEYAAAERWLVSQGFTVTERFPHRLSLFVKGRVALIESALQTQFGRVALRGRETSAAIAAPTVPQWLATSLVGINGLQPYREARKFSTALALSHATGAIPYFPQDIVAAYNAAGLAQTGTGQTIAIVIDALPNRTDLATFWTGCGVSQIQSRVEFVSLATSLPAASGEETLDAEWASAIAPGATVRVYATGSLADSALDRAYARIVQDAATNSGLRQVSLSYGADEIAYSASYLQSQSQYFAAMAGAGISVFVSSGDTGNVGYYNPTKVTVSYPASDPYVTGVGGTSLTLTNTGAIAGETAWSGSGGGLSTVFARPTWQTLANTKRAVPDLCAVADPNTGALVVLNDKLYQYGGTSWSAPVMAAFCARINQARTAAGLAPVGLFASKIYGTSAAFRDITVGSNGYTATTGFDLCTGLGSPKVATLLAALATGTTTATGPKITTQPASTTIASGKTATLSVAATGTGTLAYQWYQGASGVTTSPIGTAKAASFTTPALATATTYWVAVTDSTGTTKSNAATVSIAKAPTLTGQPASVTVALGASATFTVAATGTPATFTYQWQRLPKGSTTWANLAASTTYGGVATATLTVAGTTAAMSGDQFRCVVANGTTPNATSSAATLTVKVAPPTIVSLAASVVSTGATGAVVKMTVGASGTGPITYQWYQGASGVKTAPVAGATAATYTTGKLTKSTSYWVAVTNAGGTANSSAITITFK